MLVHNRTNKSVRLDLYGVNECRLKKTSIKFLED